MGCQRVAAGADGVALDGPEVTAPEVRVLFSCTGVGIFNRGIESFFREAFDGLEGVGGVDLRLIKGGGEPLDREWVVRTLPRTGRAATLLGKLTRRNGYVVEQWTSFPDIVRRVRTYRPDVIFYSDANLGFLLYWFRKQIGVPYKLLFSNGGPCHPPFVRTDFVHQVAPLYYDEALKFGDPPGRHFFVPYGISVGNPPAVDVLGKRALRLQLGLPCDRPVVLSVGWVARRHKRMDYLIEEIARLPEPRPYLQLLGTIDAESHEVIDQGMRLLGSDGFGVASVAYEQVTDYYRAADVFVLASLKEGFGRVYLEALLNGLPVIGHRHPVIEYVLGDAGIVSDLSFEGGLQQPLIRALAMSAEPSAAYERWFNVRERFSWDVLAPKYADMFRAVARHVSR